MVVLITISTFVAGLITKNIELLKVSGLFAISWAILYKK